jgi:hypothetical protein
VWSYQRQTFKKQNKILNKINIEGWNWEKKNQSKGHCKKTKIAVKRIRTKFDIKVKWD